MLLMRRNKNSQKYRIIIVKFFSFLSFSVRKTMMTKKKSPHRMKTKKGLSEENSKKMITLDCKDFSQATK